MKVVNIPAQTPFPIYGTVTLATKGYGSTAVAQEGCRVWIKDRTEGTVRISYSGKATKEDIYITQTNTSGYYILDLADLTTAYANGDSVRVYLEWDGHITWRDVTIESAEGLKLVNFTLHKHSGLLKGCKKTVDLTDRKYGLHTLGTGLRPGLKSGYRGYQVTS